MKKQVKKLSKKILVLVLATSIIFTSCFSYKKINAHATSVAVGLSAYTLYELCLYFGGLAVTALGVGYFYENRDDIAEFGKTVIDEMSSLPEQGWFVGSHTTSGDYVYGTEALQEVQNTEWTVIQGGGNSPQNDNDGDGDEDEDDILHELNLNGYFLTQAGVNLFQNHIKPIYESWVDEEKNILVLPDTNIKIHNDYSSSSHFSSSTRTAKLASMLEDSKDNPIHFDGYDVTYDGYYLGYNTTNYRTKIDNFAISEYPLVLFMGLRDGGGYYIGIPDPPYGYFSSCALYYVKYTDWIAYEGALTACNLPIITTEAELDAYTNYGIIPGVHSRLYRVADWIKDDNEWQGYLEDIAISLRSLQDLTAIAQQLADGVLTTQPTADAYGDMLDNLGTEYSPLTDPIIEPVYYPATNPTPQLDPSAFPNYVPSTNPDVGGGTDEPDNPDDGGSDEDVEIDLDGLTSIFNILFYLIMILVMLLYLFISCLAFIVMIFRIPASSSMLPDEMVMGFEHLKTIMIPGMNISIYGFAMALIYMIIFFAVIKLIRLEINDFKFPRSYK